MDKEEREALEMTREELLAMEGKPARMARRMPRRIRKKQDLNQRAAAIVGEATESSGIAWNIESIAITGISTARRPEAQVEFPDHRPKVVIEP